jgi:hypothetical protein
MSKVPKKLQPFNEPGRNQTYNVNGVDYKNENAVSGRGRKRRIGKSDNEEQQQQQHQQHRVAPASRSTAAVDVIEILDDDDHDDDDDDDDENLNVKPAAKPRKKRRGRGRGPIANYSVSEEIEILDDDDDDDLDRKPASKPSAASSSSDDEVQVLDQSDMDNRKAPSAAAATAGRKAPPAATAINVEENPETAAFLSVLEIVTDVDESFLKKTLREQAYRTEVVVAILLESDYPKQTKPISIDVPARANYSNNSKSAAVVVRGRKSIAPKYDYSSPTSFEPSDEYENQVIELLQYDFCFLKKNNVRTLLSQNHGRYTMTRNYIHDTIVGKSPNDSDGGKGVAAAAGSDAAEKAKKEENQHYQILKAVLIRGRISEEVKLRIGSVMQCMQKPRKKIGVCGPTLTDPVLQDEHHHYEKKFKDWMEKIQHRLRREAVRKFSVEEGSTVECGICFDDVAKEECVPCKERGVSAGR